jgi:hypothetical protein
VWRLLVREAVAAAIVWAVTTSLYFWKDRKNKKTRKNKRADQDMKIGSKKIIALAASLVCATFGACQAAPEAGPTSVSAPAPVESAPVVAPAKPGVYSETKHGATRYRLTVKGHAFTSRGAIEKYLLYRAAELTQELHFQWFTLAESRRKGDTAPLLKPDPTGLRFSFRLSSWRPVWRYKLAGTSAWSSWSPFASAAFFADGKDPKTVKEFEVSADIVMHAGPMDDSNPLAFEPGAVSDFLVNQVSPPE